MMHVFIANTVHSFEVAKHSGKYFYSHQSVLHKGTFVRYKPSYTEIKRTGKEEM